MWTTSMLDYAVLAIELSDLDAAAQLLAIIEPYAGELATSLGPVAAYSGRAASRLGRSGGLPAWAGRAASRLGRTGGLPPGPDGRPRAVAASSHLRHAHVAAFSGSACLNAIPALRYAMLAS
jgi:hypothetical protein